MEVKVEIIIIHPKANEHGDVHEIQLAHGANVPAAPRYLRSMDSHQIPAEQKSEEDSVNLAFGFKVHDMHIG